MESTQLMTIVDEPTLDLVDVDTPDIDREAFELAIEAGAVTRPTVDIVIVTHNSRSDLERCLSSIEVAAHYSGARILVADNCSTDGSLEFCAGRPSGRVEAISLGENAGYAAAVNAAAECSSADYLVILNPDVTFPSEDALTRLVDHLENHPAAAVAVPRMTDPDGAAQSSARTVPNLGMLAARQTRLGQTRWGAAAAERYLQAPSSEKSFATVEWAIGAAMVVRRRDFDRVNGWDSDFFLYFEDVDFCTRLRKAGRQIHWVRDVHALHDHHRESDRTNGSAVRSAARRAHMRSGVRFYRKHPRYALRGLFGDYRRRRVANGVRRMVDVVVATALLLVLAPLFALVAAAIALEGGGPVIYRQRRLGKNAGSFTMWKFRTMTCGTEEQDERDAERTAMHVRGDLVGAVDGRRVFKDVRDDAITRVGRCLRRWSLDELPQLANVLRGDMTLVGFRPPLEREVCHYPEWYHGRFELKPGLTGLWQVSGRNERTYEEMVQFDLEYATRRSVLLDVAVLVRTPVAVLARRGAV